MQNDRTPLLGRIHGSRTGPPPVDSRAKTWHGGANHTARAMRVRRKGGTGGLGGLAQNVYDDMDDELRKGRSGTRGTDTTFGAYSSANGKQYPVGVTDVETGAYYGASGINGIQASNTENTADSGAPNTGNGGNGGNSGRNGRYKNLFSDDGHFTGRKWVIESVPGSSGGDGADGIIIVRYNNPGVTA